MTFSVSAFDGEAGQLGVAVASCVLGVGDRVPAGRAGAGVVATQAGGQLWHGPSLLAWLARGATAWEALTALRAQPDAEGLQVGVVDRHGQAAAWTGPRCEAVAEQATDDGVVAVGNTLAATGTAAAMVAAARGASGGLRERLLAGLRAGDTAGGDLRGRQSAALVCVPVDGDAVRTGDETDPFLTLRVDDHRDPVAELARLLLVRRAHEHVMRGWRLTRDDWAAAADELRAARELVPDDPLAVFTAAVAASLAGHDDAEALLRDAARANPAADERLRRAAAVHAHIADHPRYPGALAILERHRAAR